MDNFEVPILPIRPQLTTLQQQSIIMWHRLWDHVIDVKPHLHQLHLTKSYVRVLCKVLHIEIRLLLLMDIVEEGLVLCVFEITVNHP